MSADDDDLGLPVPKAYRMQDHYTAVVSKNTLKKDSPFVLQVVPYCPMLYTLTFTFTENSRSFLFVSLVQPSQPKGLYVAGWVHRVNKQKKQVEFCDDQEFMPREYEIKNGKVVNQAFPNNCDYAFANVCCIPVHFALFRMQFSFQPKEASGCKLLSSGVIRRLHTRSGCILAVSSSGCTFPTFPFLFNRLSTFGVFTRRSGQRSRSS